MTLAIALASPLLAFVGAYAGHRRAGRADERLDRWRRREETMRMMRWAVDHCHAQERSERETGLVVLEALLESEILQREIDRSYGKLLAASHTRSYDDKANTNGGDPMTERKYRLPLDERIRFARLSVKAARLADEDADDDVRELAAMALPWESETPSEYAL